MQIYDISIIGLILGFVLLAIPIAIIKIVKLDMVKESLTSIIRMTVQLSLVGIFLTFVFDLDNSLLNISWIFVMIAVASYESVLRQDLRFNKVYMPTIVAFLVGNLVILFYLNLFVLNLNNAFDARFLIPIAGILLGNSLNGNIIGVSNYYHSIKRNENRYISSISFGAKTHEALLPFLRNGLRSALKPAVGDIATIGIVHIPGMMSGQMVAGFSPIVAIKYQIAVMIGVYVTTVICVALSIVLTSMINFDKYGFLKKDIFKNPA